LESNFRMRRQPGVGFPDAPNAAIRRDFPAKFGKK
jgi:hypothetical protein